MDFNAINTHIQYWKISAQENLKTAEILFNAKRYDSCLFFCHLSIEKILKALFVLRNKTEAPYIHDLVVLAQRASLSLTQEQIDNFETMTSFNIQGRYIDVKLEFYKKYNNRLIAQKYLKVTREYLVWLKKELTKK